MRGTGQKLSLKARAIALLAQREHSRPELERKLLRLARVQAQDLTPSPASAAHSRRGAKPLRASDDWLAAESHAPVLSGDGDVMQHGSGGGVAFEFPDDGRSSDAGDTQAQAAARAEAVRLLLDWLEAQGYLNESRFIESRIHARTARYGNLRIQQELAQHGLSPDAETRQRLNDSELERARQVWQRKFDALPTDAEARAKQTRFLAGRGFSTDVIRKVLRSNEDD